MNNVVTLDSMHKQLLEALRHREQEIFQYLVILVPALGGFVWLIYKDVSIFLFTAGTIGALLLLLLGAVYSLALGYNYRYVTLQLAKLEVALQIRDATLQNWSKSPIDFLYRYESFCCYPWYKPTDMIPEIIKVFWLAFIIGIFFVSVAGGLKVAVYSYIPNYGALVLIGFIGLTCLCLGWYGIPRYFGCKLCSYCKKELWSGKWCCLKRKYEETRLRK